MPISERLTPRIALTKWRYMTIICLITSPQSSTKFSIMFYVQSRTDKFILLGEYNARIGSDYSTCMGDNIGKYNVGKLNGNDLGLPNICSELILLRIPFSAT